MSKLKTKNMKNYQKVPTVKKFPKTKDFSKYWSLDIVDKTRKAVPYYFKSIIRHNKT